MKPQFFSGRNKIRSRLDSIFWGTRLAAQNAVRFYDTVPGSGGAMQSLIEGYPDGLHNQLERAVLEACQWLLRGVGS